LPTDGVAVTQGGSINVEKGSLSLSAALWMLAMPLKARAQNPCCQPGPPPVPTVSVPSEYEYVRRGDIFVPIFVQIVVGTANSDEDWCPEGNHPEAYDMWYVVGWDDHGAGGEFGYFDGGGRWVVHNGDRTTHYRISRGGEPIEPKVVRISVVVDDYALYADDPPQSSSAWGFDGYFTVWEFEIDPPYIDALPQDGATYTFTATIRPEKDHKGQSMARVIEFGLSSSSEPGYCMNAMRVQGQWTDTTAEDNDLKFAPNQPGLEVYAEGANPTNYSIAVTSRAVLSASVQVRCLDYGAYGSVWAYAYGLGLARWKGTLVERGAQIPLDQRDGLDNDGDGRVDEDLVDMQDNDGDGRIDEDAQGNCIIRWNNGAATDDNDAEPPGIV
jgi:hypothetical protein